MDERGCILCVIIEARDPFASLKKAEESNNNDNTITQQ